MPYWRMPAVKPVLREEKGVLLLKGGRTVPYVVERSPRRRRSYGFVVNAQGVVVFRAPRWVPVADLEAFGVRRQRFIANRLAEIANRTQKTAHKAEETAALDGKWCELPDDWYKKAARKIFPRRVAFWAGQVGVTVRAVRLTAGRQVWGSCTSAGNINLSWRLLQLEDALREYVILHEVCHRVHLNHGTRFWRLVATHMPDYETRRKAFNKLGGEAV